MFKTHSVRSAVAESLLYESLYESQISASPHTDCSQDTAALEFPFFFAFEFPLEFKELKWE